MKIEQLGPYRIGRELGQGGMGTVFEGLNLETGQRAAVKLLAAPLAQEEDFRERFEAEIETLKKLNHPNIVRLFGFGRQDQHLFYAMELVDGNSLEHELGQGRRFDWREVTRIGIETCRALRHAHDRGVIHRDIKPGNLLMAGSGQVKLSDFGIARLFGNTRLTSAGSVLGTAEYMAPEQAEGRPVSPRSDLYSLGAVMYVLLARRPLFRGDSLLEVLQKQRFEQPDPVSDHTPDVPAALEQIISQLLEKDPERRIPNPSVLARQLEEMQRALSLGPGSEEAFTTETPGGSAGRVGVARAPADGGSRNPLPGRLPPTRLADEPLAQASAVRRPSEAGCESPFEGGPPAAGLPETRATAAFKGLDKPGAAEEEEAGRHFTAVAEEDLDRVEIQPDSHALISLQTWALAAGLIAVGLTVWYFLQPPSADALHRRITARTAGGKIGSLLQAESDIEKFLGLYPKDPRCEQLQRSMTEIELDHLEGRLERLAKGVPIGEKGENPVPIQRAYVEAISYSRLDPELGMAKLQALIDLYDHRDDTSGPTAQCVELARRRLARMREQLGQPTGEYLPLVQERLDHAQQLSRSDPQRARAMYRAVIELYQHKPWAAEAVSRAREALADMDHQP